LPSVDEATLFRYYKYLTARLSFPFAATYPEAKTSLEEMEHRCTVVELLDPAKDICDEFDGSQQRTINNSDPRRAAIKAPTMPTPTLVQRLSRRSQTANMRIVVVFPH